MTSYEKHKAEMMKNPDFKKEYDKLSLKYRAIQGELRVINLAMECDVLCPRDEAFENNCTACKMFWKAWEERE